MDKTKQELTAAKCAAGYLAADMVEDGMVLGLGTGSTVFYALERLSSRVCEGLKYLRESRHPTRLHSLPVNPESRLPRSMNPRYLTLPLTGRTR